MAPSSSSDSSSSPEPATEVGHRGGGFRRTYIMGLILFLTGTTLLRTDSLGSSVTALYEKTNYEWSRATLAVHPDDDEEQRRQRETRRPPLSGHVQTLIQQLRASNGMEPATLLDYDTGGSSSGTALATQQSAGLTATATAAAAAAAASNVTTATTAGSPALVTSASPTPAPTLVPTAVPQAATTAAATPATATTAATTATNYSTAVVNKNVLDFVHHEGVVIATKVHGWWAHIDDIKQMLCLLTAAYNNRTRYDIVVFTTVAWPEKDITELEQIVHPAKVRVVIDSPPLRDVIGNLSESRRAKFLKRCNLTGIDDPGLDWTRGCDDGAIRYNWQAEFRAQHVWNMPEIQPYKYMMWVDADAFAAGVWQQDPVAEMIRYDLVLLFDNFPGGGSKGAEIRDRVKLAYNKTFCLINTENGHLVAHEGPPDCRAHYHQVHGFFHITNVHFYRAHQHWFDILIGEEKLVRRMDDQIGVTVPAAIAAPDRAWDMYARGIRLNVTHNRFFDGKRSQLARLYKRWWAEHAQDDFPEALQCAPLIKSNGR